MLFDHLPEEQILTIAKTCHEANRGVCIAAGDMSQQAWEDAPDWQRASCIEGVKFHVAHPGADSRASHDKWMSRKLREGWRYGAVKDAVAKTHPCLLPHNELPLHDKIKDDVFRAIVHGYLASLIDAS